MNISNLDKADVLASLYNGSKIQGMGIMQAKPGEMTKDDAQKLLDDGHTYFDYLYGKVMKIDLSGDEMRTDLYNRDNGEGAAEKILKSLT